MALSLLVTVIISTNSECCTMKIVTIPDMVNVGSRVNNVPRPIFHTGNDPFFDYVLNTFNFSFLFFFSCLLLPSFVLSKEVEPMSAFFVNLE